MKVALITPADIRYSYRSSERHIYDYTKYLHEHGIDAEVLVPDKKPEGAKERKDYAYIKERFKNVPKQNVGCVHLKFPFNFNLFAYSRLPRDRMVYFPFSIYDYVWNIVTKPKGQRYLIAAYSMHIKHGHIVENHRILEWILNSFMRTILTTSEARRNIYHHVITREAGKYLESLGIPRRNIFFVPTFVDSRFYTLASNKTRKLRVLHIGGVNKDVSIMADIIKRLKLSGDYGNFEFYFIGDAQDPWLLDAEKTDSNIHCLKGVTDAEKFRIMATLDVIIVPAVETFSRIMLEGMSSGLYVIGSSKNPATWEVRETGAKLYIAEHGNAGEYIKFLRELYRLKARPRDFHSGRVTNQNIARKRFDTKIILKQMMQMFIRAGSDGKDS